MALTNTPITGTMQYLTIGGNTYKLVDEEARERQLTATYTAATYDLQLDISSASDSDNEEF